MSVPILQGIKHQERVQALLQRFLNQLAVSGSDSVLSMSRDDDEYAENVACLERMQALHVVECVQQLTDATSWVLLPEWLRRLDVTSALKQPRPLFHHDHGDALPYLEWTDLRLMHFLHCHGWQTVVHMSQREVKSQHTDPMSVSVDDFQNSPKIWYAKQGLVQHSYLCILARFTFSLGTCLSRNF